MRLTNLHEKEESLLRNLKLVDVWEEKQAGNHLKTEKE